MAVLLIAEHDNKSLKDATAKSMTAALALGGPVDILIAGHNAKGVAERVESPRASRISHRSPDTLNFATSS